MHKKLISGIKNPTIIYIISRYATYGIQFITSLIIATSLGPYYLGVFGYINLIISYVAQINFGLPHALNVMLSVKYQNQDLSNRIIANTIAMVIALCIVITLCFLMIKIGILSIGTRYHIQEYILLIAIISVLTHVNALFSNIFRIYGKITAIAINQSLNPILTLFTLPFFKGEELLLALVISNSLSVLVSFCIYYYNCPVKIGIRLDQNIISIIGVKGWHLFLYNAAFYLILLTTKTFISGNYSIKEFGYFTFSFSLANAVLLLLNSISYLIFPKMLNRFANSTPEQIKQILEKIRIAYTSTSHLLIHLVIFFSPYFLLLFPSYSESTVSFKVTALSVILYSNSFGYQGLLMAKGKEKLLSQISLLALTLNISIGFLLVKIIHVNFDYVIVNTLITYICYVYFLAKYGHKILQIDDSLKSIFNEVFPWQMILPHLTSLILVILNVPDLYFIIPLLLYVVFNYEHFFTIKKMILSVIQDSKLINI